MPAAKPSLQKTKDRPVDDEAHYDPDTAVWKRGRHAGKLLGIPLRGIRDSARKTQVEAAEASDLAQSEISRLEARVDFDATSVGLLRRYIEALGGKLELVAIFPTHRFAIRGAAEAKPEPRARWKA